MSGLKFEFSQKVRVRSVCQGNQSKICGKTVYFPIYNVRVPDEQVGGKYPA